MIEVSIYASEKDWIDQRCALCKRLDNDNFTIPYDSILSAARCLFGSRSVVVFKCVL